MALGALSEKTVRINLLLENGQFKEAMMEAGIATGQVGVAAEKDALGGIMNLQAGAVWAGQKIGESFRWAAGQIVESVKAASQYEEVHSKLNTVFSSITSEAQAMANQLKNAYGMSGLDAEKLLAATGDLLVGFQFSESSALDLSMQVQKLSADLASFQNLEGGTARASEIITKAMLGERDALGSLGVKISETDLKNKALAMGYKVGKDGLDKQTQAQVTLKLIMEQSAKAMGDFQRTEDSFANQQKILNAHLEDMKVELGQKLMPLFAPFTKVVNEAFEAHEGLDSKTTALIETYKEYKKIVDLLAESQGKLTEKELDNIKVKQEYLKIQFSSKLAEFRDTYEKYVNGQTIDLIVNSSGFKTAQQTMGVSGSVSGGKGKEYEEALNYYDAFLKKMLEMSEEFNNNPNSTPNAIFNFGGKTYNIDVINTKLKPFQIWWKETYKRITDEQLKIADLQDKERNDYNAMIDQLATAVQEKVMSIEEIKQKLSGMKDLASLITDVEYKIANPSVAATGVTGGEGDKGKGKSATWDSKSSKIKVMIDAGIDKEKVLAKLREDMKVVQAKFDEIKPSLEKGKGIGPITSAVVADYKAMKELEDQLTFGMDDWQKKVEGLKKDYDDLVASGHDTSGNLLEQRSAYEEMLKLETDLSKKEILKAEILGINLKLEESIKTVVGEQRETERDLEKIQAERAKDLRDQLDTASAIVGYLNGMGELLGGEVSEGMKKFASGIEQTASLMETLGVAGAGIFGVIIGEVFAFADMIQNAINAANEITPAWEDVSRAVDEAARHQAYYNTILQATADTMDLIRKGHEADDKITKEELETEKALREQNLTDYLDQIALQETSMNAALRELYKITHHKYGRLAVDIDEEGNILNLEAMDDEIESLATLQLGLEKIQGYMKNVDIDTSIFTSGGWVRDNDRTDFEKAIRDAHDLGILTQQEWQGFMMMEKGSSWDLTQAWTKFKEMIDSTYNSVDGLITGLGEIKDTAGNIIDAGGDVTSFIEQIAGYDTAERLALIATAMEQLQAQAGYLDVIGGSQTQNIQDQIALLEEQLSLTADQTEQYKLMTEIANLRKELEGDISGEIRNQITLTEELRRLTEGAAFDTENLYQIQRAMAEYQSQGYSQAQAARELSQLGVKEQLVSNSKTIYIDTIEINEAQGDTLDESTISRRAGML